LTLSISLLYSYLFCFNTTPTTDIYTLSLHDALPIFTIDSVVWFKDKLVRKYLWKKGDKGWGDGKSAQTAALTCNTPNMEMISLDLLNSAKLPAYKKFIQKNEYMHWISHPKMLTRHGLKTFEKFLKYSNNHFTLNFDFKQIAK